MPGRRPSGVRPVYAACPVSPVSPASSGGRGAVGKVFSRLNPFSVFLPLWAGRGCPGGDARTTFPYFGSRKHPVLPGRVQRRRPVRVLPRRRTAEGGLPFPPPRVQCRFAFGEGRCGYILGRRSCFSPGRAQSRGLSDRIEEREATARTSRFFVSVPAADAACGARPGRVASAAGGCGRTARRAALRESADA